MVYIRTVYEQISDYLMEKPEDFRGLEREVYMWDRNVYLTMIAVNEKFGTTFSYEEISGLLKEEGLYDEARKQTAYESEDDDGFSRSSREPQGTETEEAGEAES